MIRGRNVLARGLVIGIALLLFTAAALAQVTLGNPTPRAGTPGATKFSVAGNGFPSGTINPADVTLTFEAAPGFSGPTVTGPIVSMGGTSAIRTIAFYVPTSLTPTAATNYLVSLSGKTTTGVTFSSTKTTVTVNPLPSLASVSPASGDQGASVAVTLVGNFTNFFPNSTTASFGDGIAVGSGAQGGFGVVTVSDATHAVATINIAAGATPGFRNVTVQTGSQVVSLNNAFEVKAVAQNQPPVANAGGPYLTQLGTAINFDGSSSSDPDNDPLTYNWNFGDNQQGTGAKPNHLYAAGGSYTVSLTVTDGKGGSDTKTTTAVVNRPPVANPGGPYAVTHPGGVNFDGSGSSDPDSDSLTYAWDFGDGNTGSGVQTTHAYANPGTYTVTLTVTDGKGGSDTKTTTATDKDGNGKPTANPGGPYTGQINTELQFDGTASSDPDNDSLTYNWDFGDSQQGTGASPKHTYSTGGTFTVSLTVNDGKGGSDTKTTTVTINRPPVANPGGPYSITLPSTAIFDGGGSTDPDNDTLTYAWDFGDNEQGTGQTPTHTYAAANTYTVSLTVTDGRGGSDTKTTTIVVKPASSNHPPVAAINGPTSGQINHSYDFNATGSTDEDNDSLTYSWTFGDGGTATGESVSHSYTAGGEFTVTVTVSDGKGGSNSKSLQISIKSDVIAPTVNITAPVPLALFKTGTVTVSGAVSDDKDQSPTVKVNGVDAVVSNGQYTADNVPLREGNNTLTAVASDSAGNVGTFSIAVTLDTTAPTITITAPTASAMLMSNAVDVSGNVNDAVPGTVNSGDVTVKVNGQDAQVSNRSFSLTGLPLVPGLNTLTAVATDKAGNTSQTQVQVTLSTESAQQHIEILGGNGQNGVIGSVLPEPLAVRLLDANGIGIADRQITFTVKKSDGALSVLGQQDQTVNVQSDQDGKASVLFQLGTRVGVGINQVSVTSPGANGEVVFSETSTAGPPAAINIVGGTGQSGPVGSQLPLPFAVIVYDVGGNPLAGVPVTFAVNSGGGNFGGNPTAVVNTDGDGKATAILTLGQQEGINNNVVSVNFQGNENAGVSFMATGIAPGDPAQTTISGVTLDNADTPVPNVTVKIVGTDNSTTTDDQGRFQLTNVPVGTVSLFVDGRTSTRPETFPFLNFQLTTIAGHDNTLGGPIYLPEIDTDSSKIVGGDTDTVLTMKDVPGYQMTIFAHSATFPDGSHTGRMSLSQVHSDKVPMIPPNGSAPKYAGTLQPPGVVFNPPIKVQFPNTDGLAPGTVIDVYTYDHDLEQWVSQGPARVSADGAVIVSDAGFGITKSGWHFAPPPPPPKSCTASCKGDDCNSSTLQDPPCTCVKQPTNDGGACGGKPQGCQDQGICVSGICTGHYKEQGTDCDDGVFCTKDDKCGVVGECKGEPIDDENGPSEQVSFGFLNNIVQGIRTWKQFIPIGEDVPDAQLGGSHAVVHTCCEEKKAIVDNEQYQLQASFPAWSTGDHFINAPPWSGDYSVTVLGRSIGVKYGAHGSIQVALTAGLSYTKNGCKPEDSCWAGSVGAQVAFTGGLAGLVPNPALEPKCGDLHNEECAIVRIFADLQTGLQFSGGVGCKKITAAFDWSGLTANLGIVVLDGTAFSAQFTKTFVLFQPQHIWSTEIALPGSN